MKWEKLFATNTKKGLKYGVLTKELKTDQSQKENNRKGHRQNILVNQYKWLLSVRKIFSLTFGFKSEN